MTTTKTIIITIIIYFNLSTLVWADAGGKGRQDDDCTLSGRCGWTFQDAFCSHAKAPTQRANDTNFISHDLRYRIHSFGIAHETLYVFAAGAFFAVPLGHPPFHASYGLSPSDLSNQLPNNFYRAYRILNYNYATLVLELDDDWELFLVGSNLQDIGYCCSQIWHTQQIIRNRRHKDHYEAPPGVFRFGFNAFFGDNATVGKVMNPGKPGAANPSFTIDRVINGERFFFHVRSTLSPVDGLTRLYTITRYEQVEKEFSFKISEYLIYPQIACSFANTTTSWILERKDRLTQAQINELLPVSSNWLAARFPIVMLKNGYIYEDVMYLSKLDYLEVYNLSYPEGKPKIGSKEMVPKILVTYDAKRQWISENTLKCELADEDNHQYKRTVQLGLSFLVATLLLAILLFVNKVNSGASRKYLNNGGHLIRLTTAMVYEAKSENKKSK